MFVDASVIVAMLAAEDDASALSARLIEAEHLATSPIAIYEAVLGLVRSQRMSIIDAETAVHDLLAHASVEIVPITAEIGRAAIRAFERYGRGRHPAQLNMGDCLAYACARAHGVPLLYNGDVFSQTDIVAG